jgi:hypothetical protein
MILQEMLMIIYRKKADGISEYSNFLKINKIIFHHKFYDFFLIDILRQKRHYIDNYGNYIESEARMEDGDYVEDVALTYEQLRARNAIKRMKERQEEEDELLNSNTLLNNERAEQNRNENKDKHDKERNERR